MKIKGCVAAAGKGFEFQSKERKLSGLLDSEPVVGASLSTSLYPHGSSPLPTPLSLPHTSSPQATHDSDDLTLNQKGTAATSKAPESSPSPTTNVVDVNGIKAVGPRSLGGIPVWQVVGSVVVFVTLLVMLLPRLMRLIRRKTKTGKRTE